jgi:KUP system potassium uptake protein
VVVMMRATEQRTRPPSRRRARARDGRKAGPRSHLGLLSLGALGVVYGDIGTSPLYAFREAIRASGGQAVAVDRLAVLGILSMVFWALVVVVTIKYLAVVLRADNHGEGGILALTSLILPATGAGSRRRTGLVLLGLFGTALLYGDGIITPAISVLAAVEGLAIAAPQTSGWVVPIAVAILVGLFSVQHWGTERVGAAFGPVMITWFATLAALGAWHLVRAPEVLAAVDPSHAVAFAQARPAVALAALGGVLLVVTGAEALYADMGHFGTRPIRLGWFSVVLPALLLNYFGQGALLLADPAAAANPFFSMAPGWALLPLVGLATAATVIASQALITGAYSLTMQAVQLGFLPRVRIDHTSPRRFGQVYLPAVNAALAVACVLLVLGFRSSEGLAAAYGIAVVSTMLITTALLAVVARERWGWSRPAAAVVIGAFLAVDLAFLGANVRKIPAGGWLPLVVGAVVFTVLTTWRRGRRHVAERRRLGAATLPDFVADVERSAPVRVPGTAVYLVADPGMAPRALEENLVTHHTLHEAVLVVSVRMADRAHLHPDDRASTTDLGAGFQQVDLVFGFMEEPDVPAALRQALDEEGRARLAGAVFFIGMETIVPTGLPGMARWRERLFVVLHRNATSAARYFRLPRDRIVVVGAVIEI